MPNRSILSTGSGINRSIGEVDYFVTPALITHISMTVKELTLQAVPATDYDVMHALFLCMSWAGFTLKYQKKAGRNLKR